ncbi:MAG: hypothetical protein UZ07_CHB004002789 [Chlorobi bacterium OLB7]|nr:MAG: hypothetical protein UZ07_CHB004002789 [Chlorobi bacterium OLB7]
MRSRRKRRKGSRSRTSRNRTAESHAARKNEARKNEAKNARNSSNRRTNTPAAAAATPGPAEAAGPKRTTRREPTVQQPTATAASAATATPASGGGEERPAKSWGPGQKGGAWKQRRSAAGSAISSAAGSRTNRAMTVPEMAAEGGRSRLIVFAKYPKAGGWKTRLSPPLLPDAAADLYRAFLLDAINAYRGIPAPIEVVIYLGAEADIPAMEALLAAAGFHGLAVRPQRGAGWGNVWSWRCRKRSTKGLPGPAWLGRTTPRFRSGSCWKASPACAMRQPWLGRQPMAAIT